MKFYQLNFNEEYGDVGDSCENVESIHCDHCDLNHSPLAGKYFSPEDWMKKLHADIYEPFNSPLMDIGSLLIARNDFINLLNQNNVTGYEVSDMKLTYRPDYNEEQEIEISGYSWLKIIGRCTTNDVWSKIESICPKCHTAKTKSIYQPYRKIIIQKPIPKTDFNRTREPQAGVIISEKIVNLLTDNFPENINEYKFKELEITA